MNAPTRRPNGTMLPGHTPNPGGRPRTAIEELRARYLPRLPEFFDGLVELATNSQSEMVRLAAIREILDRLLGKPAVVVDATHTKVDVGQLYLAALRRANGCSDQPANNDAEPLEPDDPQLIQ
jgi:hypothetical protein